MIDRREGKPRLGRHYLNVLRDTERLYLEGRDNVDRILAKFAQEWLQIKEMYLWAESHAGEDNVAAELCCYYPAEGGTLLDLHQNLNERISWLEVGRDWAIRLKRTDAFVVNLCSLGIAYKNLGSPQRAIEVHENLLSIVKNIDLRKLEALRDAGCLRNPEGSHLEISDAYRVIRESEARALGNLGTAYLHLGNSRQAITYHERSLAIVREIKNRLDEMQVLGNMGNVYLQSGNATKAIEYYLQQLDITLEINDLEGETSAFIGLGNAYSSLGKLHDATEYLKKGLAIARKLGNKRGEALALGSLGQVYRKLGRTSEALECYEQNLLYMRAFGDRYGEATTQGCIGNLRFDLGDLEGAIERYNQQLAIAEEINHLKPA